MRYGTVLLVIAVLALQAGAVYAHADTAFTYQGELNENGEPAEGMFNVDFSLWDAASGGNQIGSEIMFNDLPVTGGRIEVELDFGAAAFDNSQRWLQVTVNGTELSPRQKITPTPYSIQTRGIFVDETNQVGIGTTDPQKPLHVIGPVQSSGDNAGFNVRNPNNDLASVNLNWHNDVARIRIGGNGAGAANGLDIQTIGNNSRLRILENGNIGIGTAAPEYPLHVKATVNDDDAIYAETPASQPCIHGVATATGLFNAGVWGETNSPAGYGVLAWNHGGGTGVFGESFGGGFAIGVYGSASGGRGMLGVGQTGVQGVGTESDFLASGVGIDYDSDSSIRWKRNIEPIQQPLDTVAQLRGVYFDWDAEHGGRHDIGMIAEEVGAVLPEIVSYEANGVDARGMDYSRLTPLLVEAVNALRMEKDAEIAALNQRIAELERLVQQLSRHDPVVSSCINIDQETDE